MRRKKWIGLIPFLFAGVVIIGLGFSPTEETAREEQDGPTDSPSRRGPKASWPQIPYTPATVGDAGIDLPTMRRLELDIVPASRPGNPRHELLLERFKLLVTRHFDSSIAGELDQALRRHQIIYVMDPALEAAASFAVGEDGRPRLVLNSIQIAAIDGRRDVLGFMLVLSHEFVHYEQWRRTKDQRVRETFAMDARAISDRQTCRILWFNEREAYHRQCALGHQFGMRWRTGGEREDYCARLNSERAFDQAFYYAMASSSLTKIVRDCDDVWWDLAGGPRR